MISDNTIALTAKDFATAAAPKWCPGCGDYSIIKQIQTILPEVGVAPHNVAFISGIGCSSRFTYYMETYGMHTIHGRAPGVASGLKIARPEISVWVITGDGDALSIGGNHFIHLLRRNLDMNVVLFNNRIYGLTKGQYSPTTPVGTVTKSSPYGSLDEPFNPAMLALGAGGTFISRGLDRDPKNLQKILLEGARHKGTSFIEVFQNCAVFNNGHFDEFSQKGTKEDLDLILEEGRPMIFGAENEKGILFDGTQARVVNYAEEGIAEENLMIHDSRNRTQAFILAGMCCNPDSRGNRLPMPFGVMYREDRPVYEELVEEQVQQVCDKFGQDYSLDKLLSGDVTWTV